MPNSVGPSENGRRSVSTQLLSPPDSTSNSSRSVSTASSSSALHTTDTTHILVPDILESAITYEFIGFIRHKAEELFENWKRLSSQMKEQIGFLGFAQVHVESNLRTIIDDSDDWRDSMTQIGIHSRIRDALMKPQHRQIRLTMSLSEWISTIVETNFKTIEHLNANIEKHMNSNAAPSIRDGQEDLDIQPVVPKDHIVLYKSKPFCFFQDAFRDDGSIHLGKLESEKPTDFARNGGLYLSSQKWVAIHYASILNAACVRADVRTLELHVPLSYIRSLKTWNLGYGERWRSLIWHSRRSEYLPDEWVKEYSRQELIIGPVSHGANKGYSRLKSWDKVDMSNVIVNEDGEISSQHAFMKRRNLPELEKQVAGKSYLIKTFSDFKIIAHPWTDKGASE